MSGDNTDASDSDTARGLHKRRAAQHSLDDRKSLEKGEDQVAAAYALYFLLHDQIARAEDPMECASLMEEMLLRCRNAQNWNLGRPRSALRMVVNNTV